jgi:hypothetical protein
MAPIKSSRPWDCRAIGGQAAMARSEAGSTAWNSWPKLEPSLPLRAAQRTWSRRSAPRQDHRIGWDLFMRRLTRKLAVASVSAVPTRPDSRQSGGIFKPCACCQPGGYKPAENLWRAWRRLPHPAEHSSGKPPLVGADAPLDRSFIEGERRPQGASGVTPARRRFNFRRNNPRIFAGMTQQNRVAKHARTQKTGFSPD